MTTRPTTSPLWATDDTFSDGVEVGLSPRLDPGAGVRAQGIKPRRRWPARWFNSARGILGDWVDYLDQKTQHCHNVLNFGADPLGASDSTAAIAAANSAAAASGGYVWFPAGSYRHDDSLHPAPGVNWYGVPDGSFVLINHATKPQLVYDTGSSRKGFTEISGIGFGALVDNTGNAVSVSHDVRLLFRNCTWNDPGSGGSPKLKGRLASIQGTTQVAFERCELIGVGAVSLVLLASATGRLHLDRSRLVMPTTFTGPLVEIDDGSLRADACYFDVTAHGGSADIIGIIGTGGTHHVVGNEFHGLFSSGSAIAAVGGATIVERDSLFDAVNPYDITGGSLALGSELSLGAPLATSTAGTGTFVCPAGYRGQSIKFTSLSFGATGPTILLPAILYIGQPYTLTVYNAGDDTWTSGFIVSGVVVPSPIAPLQLSNIGANVRVLNLIAMDADVDGSPHWVSASDPVTAFAAA
jgi:hypothetical protein